MAVPLACHHASGSCSAQPGRGVSSESGTVAAAATAPAGLTRMAFTPLVPTSSPRNSESPILPYTEQQLHRELVEPLVSKALGAQRVQVERLGLERARSFGAELHTPRGATSAVAQLSQQLLDLGVMVEALHLRSEEHTSELQSHSDLVCRLLLEKKNKINQQIPTCARGLHALLWRRHLRSTVDPTAVASPRPRLRERTRSLDRAPRLAGTLPPHG